MVGNSQGLVPACILVPQESLDMIVEIVSRFGGKVTSTYKEDDDAWVVSERLSDAVRPGRMLKAARLRAEMTQRELAGALKIPHTHISQMEHGIRKISKEKASVFAEILKTTPQDFL